MASFTSTPTTFNNYVETTPVQAEVVVGMQKEADFKAGIQKVQGYVDSVAGLDIVKQEDKDYVSQKLNEIKQGITKNLSGDFSDQRITNQIGGAAMHIYRDPIVQNGVISTANYRKGISDIEAAQKTGKSSIQNEARFQNYANQWLTDGQIGTSFNAKYRPYKDVMGDFLTNWKEVHPSSKLTQDAFRIGADGKIEINPALNQESEEGITPDKVKQVADLVFSKPDNQEQLETDAWYKYRNMLPSQMYQSLHENYTETLDNVNKKLIDLQTKLATDKTADKTLVSNQIDGWKKFGSDTLDQYNQYTSLLQTNPDQAKALLYKNEFTQKVMNTFEWSKKSNEIKDNPLWEANMKTLNYELELSKFDWQKKYQQAELSLKQLELNSKLGKVPGQVQTVTVPGNIDSEQANATSGTFYDIRNGYQKRFNNDMKEGVNTIANASTSDTSKVLPPWKKTGDKWELNIDKTGTTGYKTKEDAQAASNRIYTDARTRYGNGTGSDPLVNQMFSKLDPSIKAVQYYDEKSSQLEEKYKPVYDKIKNILPQDFKYDLKGQEGNKIGTVTPTDLSLYWQWKNTKGATSTGAYTKLHDKLGDDGVKVLNSVIEKSHHSSTGEENLNSADVNFIKVYNNFSKSVSKDNSIIPNLQAREQDYKEAQIGYGSGHTTFVPKDENEAKGIATRLRELLQTRSQGNNASGFQDVLDELAVSKDKNTDYMAKNMGYHKQPSATGDKYYIDVNGKSVEVTGTDIQSIFPGTQLNDPFWDKYGTALSLSGRTTTEVNYKNKTIAQPYPLKMPNNSKYSVKYHLVGDGNGNYALKLYVNDTQGNVILKGANWSPGNALITQDQVETTLNNMNSDEVIEAIINQNKK